MELPNTKIFINNEWIDSNNKIKTINPFSEEVITEIDEASEEHVKLAIKAASDALKNGEWSTISPTKKSSLIMKLADLIEENCEYIASLEVMDAGKVLTDVKALDIPFSIEVVRYMGRLADKIEGKYVKIENGVTCFTIKEPVGVVAIITPWNLPLLLLILKTISAIAAGCTIVAKPSELTPLSSFFLAELIKKAGFPPGVFNLVHGYGHTVGNTLINSKGVSMISFTGSTRTGKIIIEACSNSTPIKGMALELGGKCPNIIFPDADIDEAIKVSMCSMFRMSGQTCIAPTRLYCHRSIFEEFKSKFIEKVKKEIILGDPNDPKTTMGPLISQVQLDRVMSYIEKGKLEGATLELGGNRFHMPNGKGFFVEPTIFTNVTQEMTICKEEIFGPVLCMMSFDNTEQVISMANDSDYGLASAIWSKDLSTAHYVSSKLKTGIVWVNEYFNFNPNLPFGDYYGYGREYSEEGLNEFLKVKIIKM